jgi:Eco57I restriction-modification methylase
MFARMENINDLVEKVLDLLPNYVWSDPNITFGDLAMAEGQFIKGINKRLRNHGHSDNNIRSRIFGYEWNQALINIAVNKNKIIGNFSQLDYNELLSDAFMKKLDVVVGNPPFNIAMEEAGVSGTIGNNTLYRQFIKKSFEVADVVAMVSHKGAVKFFETFDKQIDTVNMMTETDYWKYDTLYFIGRSIPKESNYIIVDKIISKIWGNNEFKLIRQNDSLMQNRRNGTVVDGDTVIVKLNGEEPMQYGNVTKPEKVVYGPKFAFTILESQPSYTVTDKPMYASCVCIFKTDTIDHANRMMLFVKNNRAFRYFNKRMKSKGHAIGINRLKKFDLSQIVTGFEYPTEWNLTAEEIYEIENS